MKMTLTMDFKAGFTFRSSATVFTARLTLARRASRL